MTGLEKKKVIEYWMNSAKEDWHTLENLKKGRRYAHALFFLHLALEKLLKALIVKNTKEHASFGHNLVYLTGKAGIDAPQQILDILSTIISFNLNARYPDEKNDFFKVANREFMLKWYKEGNIIRQWLIGMLEK